jgi:hypothetical protein
VTCINFVCELPGYGIVDFSTGLVARKHLAKGGCVSSAAPTLEFEEGCKIFYLYSLITVKACSHLEGITVDSAPVI